MTTIYCSNKFGDFLGKEKLSVSDKSVQNQLGDWNGHIVLHQRKKYLIVINNKTYYVLLFPPIKKADLRDLENLFLKRLLRQLVYDQIIAEDETLILLQRLLPVSLAKTNNDKKAIGTLNEFIFTVKYEFEYFGAEGRDFYKMTNKLNETLVGASRSKTGNYGRPCEDMKALINSIG